MRELPKTTEDRYTAVSPWCSRPDLWHSIDKSSPEEEVLEFIGGLVRMIKPNSVIVANSGMGRMVEKIGLELSRNVHGAVWWVEPDEKLAELTRDQTRYLSRVEHWARNAVPKSELMFIDDTGPRHALRDYGCELVKNAVVIFHDTAPGAEHADEVTQLELDGKILDVWHFATPRGLTMARVK